jgi:uncharacterized protein (TIGR02996 family)
MTSEEALLHAIRESPQDDAPCLVYADWLEENDQPERAQLVRLQCELAGLHEYHPARPALLRRQSELLEAHGEAWRARLPSWVRKKAEFRRGVVAHLSLTGRQFLQRGAGLRAQVPAFDSLRLRNLTGLVPRLCSSGLLAGLDALNLSFNSLTDEDATCLAGCPDLGELLELDLGHNVFGPDACRGLASSPHLAGLRTLQVSWCNRALVLAVAESPSLTRLKRFQMVDGKVTPADVAALAASPVSAGLRELGLSFNPLGTEGAVAIASSPHLTELRWLSLWSCDLGDEEARALAGSANLRGVWYLGLDWNSLGPEGVLALARSPYLGGCCGWTWSATPWATRGWRPWPPRPACPG